MSTNVCRQGCWCRGGGGERAHIAGCFQTEERHGLREEVAGVDGQCSSSGGGANGDADVVATGVVSRGEGGAGAGSDVAVVVTGVVSKGWGGAGAGSFTDVVATGVVNGLEDYKGAGIDMDGVFSDAADGSGLADRTLVHALIYCVGLRPAVREPVPQHYSSLLDGIGNHGVSWEARINLNRVYLHAAPTASRGILSPGCPGTVEQPGGTCAPCLDTKQSTCPLAPIFSSRRSVVGLGLKASSTFTSSTPCSNVPLKCKFCTSEVWVWKNSMLYHVEQRSIPLRWL